MADRAASRGSGDGIQVAILETGMGSAGTILETEVSGARRSRPDVGNLASGTSLVQSWSARAQKRLSRCGTFGKAACVSGADLELCARYRTASVADTHAHKVSTDA